MKKKKRKNRIKVLADLMLGEGALPVCRLSSAHLSSVVESRKRKGRLSFAFLQGHSFRL
jgi:hypothetical protein